jgi:hypothetical protein
MHSPIVVPPLKTGVRRLEVDDAFAQTPQLANRSIDRAPFAQHKQ